MKIRLTENQFRNIIENSVFNDPKALALVNFLNDTEQEEEYGLSEIIPLKYDHYGLTQYKVKDRKYIVGTDEEANKSAFEVAKDMISDSPLDFLSNEFIIQHSSVLKNDKISNDILEVLRNETKTNTGSFIFDRLIDDFDKIIRDIIKLHGRAEYISFSDQTEYKSGNYYIYKIE